MSWTHAATKMPHEMSNGSVSCALALHRSKHLYGYYMVQKTLWLDEVTATAYTAVWLIAEAL
jgi:hypothetical protein